MIDPLEVELASYRSWVAFEERDYHGWMLRFAEGATKRANSVNVISLIDRPLPEAISGCESFYADRSQPAIFRLVSFVDNVLLDDYLATAGYSFVDPSLVLYQSIDSVQDEGDDPINLDRLSWLKAFCSLSNVDFVSQETHEKILANVPSPSLFALLKNEEQPVACGLGIIYQDWFGLFDVVTAAQVRNQGYSTMLVRKMLRWAKRQKAKHCYLQVAANNAPAIRLYEKLGYRYLYHYWYRIQGRSQSRSCSPPSAPSFTS